METPLSASRDNIQRMARHWRLFLSAILHHLPSQFSSALFSSDVISGISFVVLVGVLYALDPQTRIRFRHRPTELDTAIINSRFNKRRLPIHLCIHIRSLSIPFLQQVRSGQIPGCRQALVEFLNL